jgi:large subunit ribosomal protein L25
MATVKELKATARPQSGKGAARAERRAGRVPGVIYGNNQPPVTISVDDKELRQRILAGRFLTTIYDIDLEGKKHRVIPRDFHLDPVRDFPLHVDFMRLGEGATIRVSVPLRVQNGEASPGVKRGGTVNTSPTPSISNARSTIFRSTSRPMSARWKSAIRCICPRSSCRPA